MYMLQIYVGRGCLRFHNQNSVYLILVQSNKEFMWDLNEIIKETSTDGEIIGPSCIVLAKKVKRG